MSGTRGLRRHRMTQWIARRHAFPGELRPFTMHHGRDAKKPRTRTVRNVVAVFGLLAEISCPAFLERFTFASPTCNPQPRIHALLIIGVFPSRAAAEVPSLGHKPQDVPKRPPLFPAPSPNRGGGRLRVPGLTLRARNCRTFGA